MKRNLFILATGADTAGTSVRLAQAFQRKARVSPESAVWEVHSMVAATNYIEYTQDLPYSRAGLFQHYDEADVVQLNSTMHGNEWYDRGQKKPTVLMHHGIHHGHFDKNIYECVADAKKLNATQVGSTVNLELLAKLGPPGPKTVTWLPTPYDLFALQEMRMRLYEPLEASIGGRSRQIIRVAHAPTDRAIKSTEAFISAMNSLKERGYPVEVVLIERQTHAKTMHLKAKYADILVDQLQLGYGCNAIEAWALGIPVIGAVNEHPDWRTHMQRRFGLVESPTGLPFLETNEEGLESAILELVESAQARMDWASIGEAHINRHHSEPSVVKLATQIYEAAALLPTAPVPPLVTPSMKGRSQDEKLLELRRVRAVQRQVAVEQQRRRVTGKDLQ